MDLNDQNSQLKAQRIQFYKVPIKLKTENTIFKVKK